MKKYKFSYGNIFNFFFSHFIQFIYNSFTLLVLFVLLSFLYGRLDYAFRDQTFISQIVDYIYVISLALAIAFFVGTHIIPKKIIIINNIVLIKRHYLDYRYLFRGFNDEILIREISVCKLYDGKRYKFGRDQEYAVSYFDWDDLVEIKTKDEKRYLVPIKNSDDFIEEVNKRMEKIR